MVRSSWSLVAVLAFICSGCPVSGGGGGGGGGGDDTVASLLVSNDTSWTIGDLLACVDGTFDDTSSVQNAIDNGQCVYVNVPSPGDGVLFELGTSAGLRGWDPGEDLKRRLAAANQGPPL